MDASSSNVVTPPFWGDRAGEGETPAPRRRFPPADWPSKAQLDYTQALIITTLLVLAVPYLVSKLLTDPGAVLSGLGRRAANKVGG